jgi:hypothetical protein
MSQVDGWTHFSKTFTHLYTGQLAPRWSWAPHGSIDGRYQSWQDKDGRCHREVYCRSSGMDRGLVCTLRDPRVLEVITSHSGIRWPRRSTSLILRTAWCLTGPLYQAVLQLLPLMHGAICVGIAEGALDELVELANTGRQQLRAPVPMRDSETFQGEMGRIAAELTAARAFLQVQAASHWCHALAGTLKDEALRTQGTQTAIWLAATCVRATDACFALGGSSALFDASPLQRRLRDLHVAVQHNAAQQRHYVSAGKLLLDSSVVSSKFIGDSRVGIRRVCSTAGTENH